MPNTYALPIMACSVIEKENVQRATLSGFFVVFIYFCTNHLILDVACSFNLLKCLEQDCPSSPYNCTMSATASRRHDIVYLDTKD